MPDRTRLHRAVAAIGAVLILATSAACGTPAEPDKIGLRYAKGPTEGYKFEGCIEPSTIGGMNSNDEIIWMPENLRYWKVTKTPDADSQNVLTVIANSAPGPDGVSPGGVQVDVPYQATMKLNTNCDDTTGGVLRQFWETIGRRMHADTDAGWKDMMGVTVETALNNSAKAVLRTYTPEVLVAGSKQTEIQAAIGPAFNAELVRLTGGAFFCGPEFQRGKAVKWTVANADGTTKEHEGDCPPVQISIQGPTYTNPEVQAAADKRAAAVQNAAALLAEAQGKLDAANKTGQLYNNPAWVRLQEAQMRLDAARACSANPNCTVQIIDSGGAPVIVGSK